MSPSLKRALAEFRTFAQNTSSHRAVFERFVQLSDLGLERMGVPCEDPRLIAVLRTLVAQRLQLERFDEEMPLWAYELSSQGIIHGLFEAREERIAFFYLLEEDFGIAAVFGAQQIEYLRFAMLECPPLRLWS